MVGAGAGYALRGEEVTAAGASTDKIEVWWAGPGRALPRVRLNGEPISLAALGRRYNLPEYAVLARIERGLHPSQWFLEPRELHALRKRKQAA